MTSFSYVYLMARRGRLSTGTSDVIIMGFMTYLIDIVEVLVASW